MTRCAWILAVRRKRGDVDHQHQMVGVLSIRATEAQQAADVHLPASGNPRRVQVPIRGGAAGTTQRVTQRVSGLARQRAYEHRESNDPRDLQPQHRLATAFLREPQLRPPQMVEAPHSIAPTAHPPADLDVRNIWVRARSVSLVCIVRRGPLLVKSHSVEMVHAFSLQGECGQGACHRCPKARAADLAPCACRIVKRWTGSCPWEAGNRRARPETGPKAPFSCFGLGKSAT